MSRRLALVLAAAAIAAAALTGCGSDPQAPDTVAPAGYSVVKNDDAGVTLAVPDDWSSLTLTEDVSELNRTINSLRVGRPEIGEALNQARILATRLRGRVFAVHPDGSTYASVTVDRAQERTLDEVLAVVREALAEEGASGLSDERVNLAAGPAVRVSYSIEQPSEDGDGTPIDKVQYYVLKDGRAYLLEVGGEAEPDLADTIADTLRIR